MIVSHRRYRTYALIFLGLLAILVVLALSGTSVAESAIQVEPTPTLSPLSIGDDTCLECHGQPGLTLTLENGDILELYVNPDDFKNSIHGELGYACVQCHRTVGEYPHPPYSATDLRGASLDLYQACRGCHEQQYELAQDSVHARALAEGIQEAAICTDCHTAHAVRRLNDPTTGKLLDDAHVWIPTTCAKCHSAIYQKYKESVHGSALLEAGNTDVPTCIDCHGVHNIEDPTTPSFRVDSPLICAKCHTDEERMAKYGLSTNVLNTYVADFHGTTVTLFEKQSPDAETNKPVCYDCHGIHDIESVNDPEKGIHVKQNLLKRCQECHPDATINFPDSWLSHYIPSPENYPAVYYVNLFYKFFIPGVLGGMVILVALDFNNLVMTRIRKLRKVEEDQEPVTPPHTESAPGLIQQDSVIEPRESESESEPESEEDQHGDSH